MNSKEYLGRVLEGGKSSSKWMPEYIPWLYPGTLNVLLFEPMPDIIWYEEVDTDYDGVCRIARCKFNGVDAFVVNPPEVDINPPRYLVEIGHTHKLRDLFDLKNEDVVSIIFELAEGKNESPKEEGL
jgi:CTP-dependent riboflavin kinase